MYCNSNEISLFIGLLFGLLREIAGILQDKLYSCSNKCCMDIKHPLPSLSVGVTLIPFILIHSGNFGENSQDKHVMRGIGHEGGNKSNHITLITLSILA